jgi:hypothetical protein
MVLIVRPPRPWMLVITLREARRVVMTGSDPFLDAALLAWDDHI